MTEPTELAVLDPALVMPEPVLRAVVTEPGQMGVAQQDLIVWCDRKLAALQADQDEAIASFEIARKAKWRSAPLKAAADKIERRMRFYRKVKQALEAGYVIVPDFPCDVFAVRTDRKPNGAIKRWQSSVPDVPARDLAPGSGEYHPPAPMVRHRDYQVMKDGKEVTIQNWWAVDHADMEFPVALAAPAVLSAAAEAMALRLFDEMAIVLPSSQRDPIVTGRIIDPTRGGSRRAWQHRCAFFVAWWCRESDL